VGGEQFLFDTNRRGPFRTADREMEKKYLEKPVIGRKGREKTRARGTSL